MKISCCRVVWAVGLMSINVAALAGPDIPDGRTSPQEPAGFIAGGVIGGLAAGPIGAVIGAGVGTWLGNRVHRAGEVQKGNEKVASKVLDGLQADVLFRTGSAAIAPDIAQGIRGLAAAVAQSPALKVRVDAYADARGGVETNLALSEARAEAVRDLFLASGVNKDSLEINAYGKSRSVAQDVDGYALERRVRLTLRADGPATMAQASGNP